MSNLFNTESNLEPHTRYLISMAMDYSYGSHSYTDIYVRMPPFCISGCLNLQTFSFQMSNLLYREQILRQTFNPIKGTKVFCCCFGSHFYREISARSKISSNSGCHNSKNFTFPPKHDCHFFTIL